MARAWRTGAMLLATLAAPSMARTSVVPPTKAWSVDGDCQWWLSGSDGKSLHASIGSGGDEPDPVLTVADPAFLAISEEARPTVRLSAGSDPKRSVDLEGWATHVGHDTAMIGVRLDAKARLVLGGATQIRLSIDKSAHVELPLAATPTRQMLDRCVRPDARRGDSE